MAEESPRPDVPTPEAPQVYRPLSLLAVLALTLGALFSVLVLVGGLIPFARTYPRGFVLLLLLAPVVGGLGAVLTRRKGAAIATVAAAALGVVVVLIGLGGLVAFSGTAPWLLDGWVWFLLLGAILVSLVALSRIRASEGSLAGLEMARWGLWLSIAFGGYYLLYWAGNAFAVGAQATSAADQFLQDIRDDKLPEAFVRTLKPGTEPVGGDLRAALYMGHNTPNKGNTQPGEFNAFCNCRLVQRLRSGGKATVTRKAAAVQYEPTGYQARVTFDVTNDEGRFDVNVGLLSVESARQRQWYVTIGYCQLIEKQLSDEAVRLDKAIDETRRIPYDWVEALKAGRAEEAFLMTLSGERRATLMTAHLVAQEELPLMTGFAPLALRSRTAADLARLRQGMKTQSKELLDEDKFQTDRPAARALLLNEVRAFLTNEKKTVPFADQLIVERPAARIDGDEVEVSWPVRMVFAITSLDGQQQRYIVEADLLCRGATTGSAPAWQRYRITKLRPQFGVILRAAPPGLQPPQIPPPPGQP